MDGNAVLGMVITIAIGLLGLYFALTAGNKYTD